MEDIRRGGEIITAMGDNADAAQWPPLFVSVASQISGCHHIAATSKDARRICLDV